MRSQKLIIGVAAVALMAGLALAGALTSNVVLLGVALTIMVGCVGVVSFASLSAQRRAVRRLDYIMRKGLPSSKPAPRVAEPPQVRDEDLIGTIRLLQAQYIGRLDRAQDAIEGAIEHLTSVTPAFEHDLDSGQDGVLVLPRTDERFAALISAAAVAGVRVVVAAPGAEQPDAGTAGDSSHLERL